MKYSIILYIAGFLSLSVYTADFNSSNEIPEKGSKSIVDELLEKAKRDVELMKQAKRSAGLSEEKGQLSSDPVKKGRESIEEGQRFSVHELYEKVSRDVALSQGKPFKPSLNTSVYCTNGQYHDFRYCDMRNKYFCHDCGYPSY